MGQPHIFVSHSHKDEDFTPRLQSLAIQGRRGSRHRKAW
jgi:hypothetical protein